MKEQHSVVKQLHSLYGHANADEFMKALVREGIDIDEVLSTSISDDRAGVLLAGSLAEGVGNGASDVDLLVLVESQSSVPAEPSGLTLQAGRAIETLLYRSGVEINLEIFARADVERLMDSFVSIAPALYDPSELKRIPMLQAYDLRFLHRLRAGWPLRGLPMIEVWRDEFMTDLLGTYLTVLNFNLFGEFFEDAASMLYEKPLSSIYVGRRALEHLLRSLLAHVGFTSSNNKWLLYWCDQASGTEAGPLLPRGLDLLVGHAPVSDAYAYLENLRVFGMDVLSLLRRDPEVRRATDFLRDRISYVPLSQPR